MSLFDTFVMVDWSGGNDTGPTPRKDAIWACVGRGGTVETPVYLRNRQKAETWIGDLLAAEREKGRRIMIGFDFPFGYPEGFAKAVCGSDDPLSLWNWLEERIEDGPRANNRFDLAARINIATTGGKGPFWANALGRDIPGLERTKQGYENPFPDRRACEALASGSFTCWQLAGAGAVGSQVLMGLPVLARLRRRFGGDVAVWPFEGAKAPIAFVEIWPSLSLGKEPQGEIRDAWQVSEVVRSVMAMPDEDLERWLDVQAPEEGWIFGLGFEETVRPGLAPPVLRNDCFALPVGVDWIPVDDALEYLERAMSPCVGCETVALAQGAGRVLAEDLVARRSNPPHANSAVDGYGFAGGRDAGPHVLRLQNAAAKAGGQAPRVPEGEAVRILTGAVLPDGVDTVVLQEDVSVDARHVAFNGPVKPGSNTRNAGEDVLAGDTILQQGWRMRPADLAIAAAAGIGELRVFRPLRVGVLSTGDELVEAGAPAPRGKIHDANRPMLLSLLNAWGFDAVDLGCVADDRQALRGTLDSGAAKVDAILTSGGASAGDEDHVSALLSEAEGLEMWRIAIKPGRPLALGIWQGVPVFGLPGNPVAAMVCSLVFAGPSLRRLSGEPWKTPEPFLVPSGFGKSKKAGRREFLRARVHEGRVERFMSEGSGRISGLSWADGLVELPDEAMEVSEGDLVRFYPYSAFGV